MLSLMKLISKIWGALIWMAGYYTVQMSLDFSKLSVFLFSFQTRAHVTNSSQFFAHRSAVIIHWAVTSIKELFFSLLSKCFVFQKPIARAQHFWDVMLHSNTVYAWGGVAEAVTGSHTHLRSCLHDVGGAFLHSHNTACLTGSFWLVHSRVMSLGQGGNVWVNSGKEKTNKSDNLVLLE